MSSAFRDSPPSWAIHDNGQWIIRQMKHRKPTRLKEYDYTQAGAYSVTICTHNRECLFGDVDNGEMVLNEPGNMIQTIWREIPLYYQNIQIDEFIIMPNHVHGIIVINDSNIAVGTGPCACPLLSGPTQGSAPTLSLSDVIHRFKTLTTKKYIDGVKNNAWPPFDKHLWQKSFYDHIIRDDTSLNKIREYIVNNPAQWDTDEDNVKICGNQKS